jgi:proteic killer suppression protein
MAIRTFRHKGLSELWGANRTAKIDRRFHKRIIERLDALEQAAAPEDMNLPGFNFHPLQGFDRVRYSVHVNGPWCVTFEFEDGDALRVDFEQYH